MQGGDENKGNDMSAYLSNISILADAIDAFVASYFIFDFFIQKHFKFLDSFSIKWDINLLS